MNYKHAFHAGNFSDVFKHLVLLTLSQNLLSKQTPLCYLETHAGRGLYDLSGSEAMRTQEYQTGIARLTTLQNPPRLIQQYCTWVKKFKPYYPGSCLLMEQRLRPKDRLVLSELHPEEHHALKFLFQKNRRVSVHKQNGYTALKAFLPPPEKRGIVFIDSPYENPEEHLLLRQAVTMALKKWPHGVYAIWYPLKTEKQVFELPHENKLDLRLLVRTKVVPGCLNGCGIFIINPPWQFKEQVYTWLPWLQKNLKITNTVQTKHYQSSRKEYE